MPSNYECSNIKVTEKWKEGGNLVEMPMDTCPQLLNKVRYLPLTDLVAKHPNSLMGSGKTGMSSMMFELRATKLSKY